MSSCREALIALVLASSALGAFAQAAKPAAPAEFPGIGRSATPKEVQAWDIDVRPDFKGLPRGAGTVAKGQEVWEAKCASCHGVFGESNEVFSPLVGGTTAKDIETGRVARLTDAAFPGRTTLMKLSSLSTLWDYINRAMPWTNPKTLSTEEVYAVTAFILNLGGIVPDDFTLSDANIAQVQQRLPNRNGMTTDHGLWPGRSLGNGGKPDVRAAACMSNCATEPKVASLLPDHARNAHGNLAEQKRPLGPMRGIDTTRYDPKAAAAKPVAVAAVASAGPNPQDLLKRQACTACHAANNRIVGPSFTEIVGKHGARADAASYLAEKIKAGGVGVWGQIPMPAQPGLKDDEAAVLAKWILGGAK